MKRSHLVEEVLAVIMLEGLKIFTDSLSYDTEHLIHKDSKIHSKYI
jgi:hypothetical protein